jgi:hypothetical protein
MRSGTTLVQRLFCTAPDVNDLVPEVHVLRDMITLYKHTMNRRPCAREPFFSDTEECMQFFAHCVDDLLRIVRDRHNPNGMLVLKNPELTRYFPELLKLHPAVRFVIVVRDPRDVVASMKVVAARARAAGEPLPMPEMADGIKGMATLCQQYYRNIFASPLVRDPERLTFVRYEDIVTDTTATVEKLSRWSGLEIRPQAVAGDNGGDDGTPFGAHLHGQKISSDSIGNFRTRLEPAEVTVVETVAEKFMKAFGYESPVGG